MEDILSILQTASPLGIIALLVIVIFQLIGGKNIIDKIRGTQKEKYPSIENYMESIKQLSIQNETLLENHFKHEIPEMINSVNKIENKVDKIDEKVDKIGDRLLILETKFYISKEDK
jgi:uncharacterized protein Yka (UPF0111/DUF47 family)